MLEKNNLYNKNMKKVTLLILSASMMFMLSSCFNNQSKQAKKAIETKTTTTKLESNYLADQLSPETKEKATELFKELAQIPANTNFIQNEPKNNDTKNVFENIKLNFLLPLSHIDNIFIRRQKIAALLVYISEMQILKNANKPTDGYKEVISKLVADINSPYLAKFINSDPNFLKDDGNKINNEDIVKLNNLLIDGAKSTKVGETYFVMKLAAQVEIMYITLMQIEYGEDLFITDESVAHISKITTKLCDIIDCIEKEVPQLKEFDFKVLKAINATNVKEFKAQVVAQKGRIISLRNSMLNLNSEL